MTRLGRHWPALLVLGLSAWMLWLAAQPGAGAAIGPSDPAWPTNWGWAGFGPDLLAILAVLASAMWADRHVGRIGLAARVGLWLVAAGFAANGVGAAASGPLAHVPPGSALDVWWWGWSGPWPPASNPADFAAGVGFLLLAGSWVRPLLARWWGRWTTAAVGALAGLAALVAAGTIDAAIRSAEWSAWVEASSRFHG
ncbi:MAG: hypothetical protein M1522_02300 [Actinobacteria bacterium]|nr:hypothetical protein [Actinomycetota bacterium]